MTVYSVLINIVSQCVYIYIYIYTYIPKKAPNVQEMETQKKLLYFRKGNFFIILQMELSYISEKVYSEP